MISIPEKLVFNNKAFKFVLRGRGRFKEEFNYTVFLNEEKLCDMKVFHGRGFYKPWIELYNFTHTWNLLRNNRPLLKEFLKFFSSILGEGESLFIEYYHDPQLTKELERGTNVKDTFLGKVLSEVGFKGFRDWYIPEGMWEGGQKIEAWK